MYLIIHILLLTFIHHVNGGAPDASKTFTVTQSIRPRILSKDVIPHQGIAAYAKALGKFGAPAETVSFLSALALDRGNLGRDVSDIPHPSKLPRDVPPPPNPYPQVAGPLSTIPGPYDIFYTTQITIGDQQFWMDFDTGSSDLWVFGPNITGLAPNQSQWHESSTSQQLPGYSFFIAYGDGSFATGDVWTDQIMLGSVVISNTTVEVADSAGGSFEAPISGVLGLGFDVNNQVLPIQRPTLFTDLITRDLIAQPLLATDLRHNEPGCYTFGAIPSYQYSGDITYIPVDPSQGYWTISPSGYGVDNNTSNDTSPPPSNLNTTAAAVEALIGVVDTGTTLIILNDTIAAAYYALVPSAILDYFFFGGYIFNCTEVLPDFELLMGGGGATNGSMTGEEGGDGGYLLRVPGEFINYAPLQDGLCYGGIQPTGGQVPFDIYGDVMIKSAFLVFDRGSSDNGGGPRMGFADKAVV